MAGTVYALLQRYMTGYWKDMSKKFNNGTLAVATATKTPNADNPLLEATTSFATLTFTGLFGYGSEMNEDGTKIAASVDKAEMYFLVTFSNLQGLTFQQFDDLLRTPDVALTITGLVGGVGQSVQLLDITHDEMCNVATVSAKRLQAGGR